MKRKLLLLVLLLTAASSDRLVNTQYRLESRTCTKVAICTDYKGRPTTCLRTGFQQRNNIIKTYTRSNNSKYQIIQYGPWGMCL